MAEVGVLNLQVRAESSEQATQSLRQLAGALQRVRNAVKGGNNLSAVGTSIEKFAEKVKNSLNDSVMGQISKLGEALGKLNNLSNVTINVRGGSVETVRQNMEEAKASAEKFGENLVERIGDGMSKLDLLREKVDILRGELSEGIDSGAFNDKQVVNYQLQIKSLEKQIGELETVAARAGEAGTWKDIVNGADTVSMYALKISDLTEKMRKGIDSGKWDMGKIADTALQISRFRDKIAQLREEANKGTLTVVDEEAKRTAEDFINTADKASLLEARIDGLKIKLGKGIISGSMDESAIARTVKDIDRLQGQYDKLTAGTMEAVGSIESIDETLENTTEAISESVSGNMSEAQQKIEDLLYLLENSFFPVWDKVEQKVVFKQGRTDYKNYNKIIDTMLGIGNATKRSKGYAEEFEALLKEQERKNAADPFKAVADSAENLENSMERVENATNQYVGFSRVWDDASRTWKEVGYTQEEFNQRVADVTAAQADISTGNEDFGEKSASAFSSISEKLSEVKAKFQDFVWMIKQTPSAIQTLKSGFAELLSPVTGLVKQFTRIAKYRALRYVLKQITSGFSEGMENVYYYSKAIKSDFADSMDSAASSMLTMKNSIGAAVTPVISALIPVLQTVVNWFITLVNYVNQFFALLTGQSTWTHAVEATTTAYEDQTNAAQSASAAVKDLLADWDELNIIQSESGGTSAGNGLNAGEEYLNMFEELAEFDNRVKDIVNFLKDNFETIKAIVLTIGAAILAWKLASTFINALSAFGVAEESIKNISSTLARGIAGVATLTVGIILGWDAGHKLASEGFTAAAALEEITSLVAGAVGGYLIAGTPGAIAGVTLTIMATVLGYIQEINLEKNAAYQDMAAEAFKHANGNVDPEEFKAALEEEFTKRVGTLSPAVDAFSGMPALSADLSEALENITKLQDKLFGDGKVTSADVAEFRENWNNAVSTLREMGNISFTTIDLGIGEMLRTANEEAQTELINLRKTFKELASLQNGTISELQYEMDQILARLSSDTGDEQQRNEDIENYKKYLNVIATMSRSEIEALSGIQEQAEGFDFASGDGGIVENAQAFIDSLSTMLNETNAKVDEWEKTQLESYAFQKQLLNAEVNAGLIDADVAKPYLEAIDNAEKLVRDHAESVRGENEKSVQEALETVMRQTLLGYQEYIGNGGEAQQYYKYVEPILTALQQAGYEVPDQFETMISQANGDSSHLSIVEWITNLLGFNTASKLSKKDVEKFLYGDDATSVAETAAEAVQGVEQETYASVQEAMEAADWTQLSDSAFESLITSLKEQFGTDKVREALENFDIPKDEIAKLFEDKIEFKAEDFSYMGISAGGDGWWSNLWNSLTQIDGDTEIPGLVYDVTIKQDPSMSEPIDAPAVDTSTFNSGLNDMWLTTKQRVSEILTLLSKLQNISFSVDTSVTTDGGFGGGGESHGFAEGGFPKSYDLVMANENGNFEMMGRMGHQPVVANNQQIVDGISKGVSSANGNMVGEMRNMVTLMQRMLNKEFVAKAVPSSAWGRNNSKSADAYSKVTG